MRTFLKFLIAISLIASSYMGYCLADEVSDRDDSIRDEDDAAPIINCKTAQQDVAALEKLIADMHTKLLQEEEGLVLPSDYKGDGIIDPEKDIEAANTQRHELEKKIKNIKEVCGLA